MDPISYTDFSGGIADSYLSTPVNRYLNSDNLLVDENGKLYTRYGIKAFSDRVDSQGERLTGLYADSEPLEYIVSVANDNVFWSDGSSWTEIVGPASNSALPNKSASTYESAISWKGQYIMAAGGGTTPPVRIYCPDLSPRSYNAIQLGLPALASAPTASGTGTGTSFAYAFHYFLEITDYDGTVYEENGPITYVSCTLNAPNSNTVTISSIPVLANTASTNYDVSTNLKIKIFRTAASGTVFFFLKTVNNGTTSTTDSVADTTLDDNEPIYTDGDVLEYREPPIKAKYVTEVNDIFWYATPRSLTHSNPGAPGAVPAEFEDFLPQMVRGLSSIISFPILFCDRSIYRIEGFFDEFGDGGWSRNEISQTAGCISNRGIVSIPGGLVWPGNGGFYFTNGNTVQKISESINRRYKFFKSTSMVGTYDAQRNLVYWTGSSTTNTGTFAPTDGLLVLHLNYGLTPYSVFTTASSANNIFPTTLFFTECEDVDEEYRNCVLIGERRGYLLYENELTFTDPKINTDQFPEDFKRTAIIYTFDTMAHDLGSDAFRKYTPTLKAVFENETDVAVQFFTRVDDGGSWAQMSEFRNDLPGLSSAVLWDISDPAWDDTTLDEYEHYWDSQPVLQGQRKLPADKLRATRRQFRITNSETWITRSDLLGTATTDTTNKTVTLDTAANFWPEDCEEYKLYFEDDDYTQSYTIIDRVSDTVVQVVDAFGDLPSGSGQKWQLKGFRKNERCRLLSFSIFSDPDESETPSFGTTGLVNA